MWDCFIVFLRRELLVSLVFWRLSRAQNRPWKETEVCIKIRLESNMCLTFSAVELGNVGRFFQLAMKESSSAMLVSLVDLRYDTNLVSLVRAHKVDWASVSRGHWGKGRTLLLWRRARTGHVGSSELGPSGRQVQTQGNAVHRSDCADLFRTWMN